MSHNPIDHYIESRPEETHAHLREMRELIQDVMPDVEESLKWSQPAYSYDTIMVQFAGHKDHVNLYTTPSGIRAMADELKEYKTGTSSIQFPYDQPLPKALIKKVVQQRVKEFREDGVTWM